MKKYFLLILCVCFGFLSYTSHTSAQQTTQAEQPTPAPCPVRVTLSTYPIENYSSKQFPVRVTLENTGDTDLRLLRRFDLRDVFFRFKIKRPDKSYIPTPIMSTADLREQDLQYLTLKPSESFGFKVDLLEILPDPRRQKQLLLAGDYEISAHYSNGYGDDCFHGITDFSDPIILHLPQDISLPLPVN